MKTKLDIINTYFNLINRNTAKYLLKKYPISIVEQVCKEKNVFQRSYLTLFNSKTFITTSSKLSMKTKLDVINPLKKYILFLNKKSIKKYFVQN